MTSDCIVCQCRSIICLSNDFSVWYKSELDQSLESVTDTKCQTVSFIDPLHNSFFDLRILECSCKEFRRTIRFITGSTNPDVLKYALLYLHVGIPMIPPMAVVVIVRNALQGMRHTLAPLICSAIELACKAVFSFKLVPALGYPAVCACEPVAWMLCMIFILAAAYAFKNDLQDVWEERI